MKLYRLILAVFVITFTCQIFPDVLTAATSSTAGSPLPVWLAPEEMARLSEIGTYSEPNSPPSGSVRCPAEYEQQQGVLMTWSFGAWEHIYLSMVESLQDQVKVYIVTTNQSSVRNSILNHGLPLTNVEFINESTNSVWMRDYGPWIIFHEDESVGITDFTYNRPRPADDVFPQELAALWSLPCYTTDLKHAGGNFMVDGMGDCYASDLVDNENSYNYDQISQIFDSYTGCHTFNMMPRTQVEYTGHIDMYAKFLDPSKLLLGEYKAPGGNDYNIIESNKDLFASLTTSYGRPPEIIRIPQPDVYSVYDVVRSYTNSLIVNNKVLLPIYNLDLDDLAVKIYQNALPSYEIYPIDCSDIIESGGAIHCITMGVPNFKMVHISHVPYMDTPPHYSDYTIKATVTPSKGRTIERVLLLWKEQHQSEFDTIPMALQGNEYVAAIPSQPAGSEVNYYIDAKDNLNSRNNHPYGAPDNHHSIICQQDAAISLDPSDTFLGAGEKLEVAIEIQNLLNTSQTLAGRVDVYFANGKPYAKNPVAGPVNFTLKPLQKIKTRLTHNLPAAMPQNLYYYRVTLANERSVDVVSKEFHFVVN